MNSTGSISLRAKKVAAASQIDTILAPAISAILKTGDLEERKLLALVCERSFKLIRKQLERNVSESVPPSLTAPSTHPSAFPRDDRADEPDSDTRSQTTREKGGNKKEKKKMGSKVEKEEQEEEVVVVEEMTTMETKRSHSQAFPPIEREVVPKRRIHPSREKRLYRKIERLQKQFKEDMEPSPLHPDIPDLPNGVVSAVSPVREEALRILANKPGGTVSARDECHLDSILLLLSRAFSS